jgi:hypothetical protein
MASREGETPPGTPTVETLQERLRHLLREREQLRGSGAEPSELERNRRAIVEAQWDLSRALIARHHPSYQAA